MGFLQSKSLRRQRVKLAYGGYDYYPVSSNISKNFEGTFYYEPKLNCSFWNVIEVKGGK